MAQLDRTDQRFDTTPCGGHPGNWVGWGWGGGLQQKDEIYFDGFVQDCRGPSQYKDAILPG